jgi:sugar-specific transcriptional regulator TrmB
MKPHDTLLAPFGFTELESRLYCELMQHASATGYRLAQLVGKAPANTYQALAGLIRKGAVISDDDEPKTYRPVPPAELFAVLRQTFDAQAEEAETALAALHQPAEQDRLYQLKTLPQAIARAQALIEGAQEILLFDLFPEPLAMLHEALAAACARGVKVGGLVYQPVSGAPFTVAVQSNAGFIAERWPGRQMTLIADAREVMLALIAPAGDELLQGLWSDSIYLACLHHSGLAAEIQLAAMKGRASPLKQFSLLTASPPGLRRLVKPEGKGS